jgi:hypothetical protein
MTSTPDGLVDILLEVTPTEEQKAERIKEHKEHKRANEEWLRKKNTKYRRSIDQEKGKTHEDMQITRNNW